MSDRKKIKKLIFSTFPNGYTSNPVSGYGHYIIKINGEYSIEHLTSGVFLGRGEIAIPPKYYKTPKEMFDDIKMYFNPKPYV